MDQLGERIIRDRDRAQQLRERAKELMDEAERLIREAIETERLLELARRA